MILPELAVAGTLVLSLQPLLFPFFFYAQSNECNLVSLFGRLST